MSTLLLYDVVVWPTIAYARRKSIFYAVLILSCISILSISTSIESTYYDALNVSYNASSRDIRRAWRRQSVEAHPDKGGTEEAFNKLRDMYDILSDDEKRKYYDLYGDTELSREHVNAEILVYYFVWTILTYVHMYQPAHVQGRSWSYLLLACMGAFEYTLKNEIYAYDMYLPPFQAVKYARESYLSFLFLCRLISEHVYVDPEEILREILYILQDVTRELKIKPRRVLKRPTPVKESSSGRWLSFAFILLLKYVLS